MKVTIIIPNYNGKEILKMNLPKILVYAGNAEIIVVDDGSTDTSVRILSKLFPQVRLFTHKKNLGFASSVNDGVKVAHGELILLLNSDTTPETNSLDFLTRHFNDPNVFAVGCLQRCKEGSQEILRGRGIGRFERGFLAHKKGEVDKTNTLWVGGGAGMFRKDLWLKLGGMDTLYSPFYWEDIDLSYRALKAGYRVLFEPKSVVVHKQHQGAIRTGYSSAFIKTVAYRNQILFVWLNITDFAYLLQHLFFLPYHLLRAIFVSDYAFIDGFFLALKEFFLVVRQRQKNISFNKISDREVLKDLSI